MIRNTSLKSAFAAVVTAALLSFVSTGSIAADIHIKVKFDGNSCPIGVDKDNGEVTRASRDKVIWTAYNDNGTSRVQVQYSIYFDPFRGKPLADSNADGVITSDPVDQNAPEAEYKYTVLGASCPQKPFDPRLRVR